MADERAIATAGSTATLERHVSMPCSRTGNTNIGTQDGLEGGGAVASSVRTGRSTVPKAPLWYRQTVERVIVSPGWSASYLGSGMVRWSMHKAMHGWCKGVNVGVLAPFHIQNRRV